MDPGQTYRNFKTTSWTMIARARDGGDDLEVLLGQYWSPVYAYLCRKGNRPDDAADLTQSFLVKVLLGRDLIGRADAARGRFRSYLLASLNRFVVDEHRRERGRNGERARMVPCDEATLRMVEPSVTDDPLRAFDRQWAAAVLHQAVQMVREDCESNGMERQWRAFEVRDLRPATRSTEPAPMDDLLEELGATSQQEIYSMLQTIRRKVQRAVRDVVAQTVETPEEVERELAELRAYLRM